MRKLSYIIEYKDENNENINEPKEDNDLKEKLQAEFLSQFFALADEIIGSSFEKYDAIKRWENLTIKKAHNVVLTIKDNNKNKSITVSSTEANDIDVLYIPIKDRHNNPTQIGEVAHDLRIPIKNINLRKFAQVFAEGVFRNQKLKSDFELYITGYLNEDENLKKDILINKGVETNHIEYMEDFIKENLLTDDEKQGLINELKKLNVSINEYSNLREFEKYKSLDISCKDFIEHFNQNEKYKAIMNNIVGEYKEYIKDEILKSIKNQENKLKILSFKEKDKKYFDNKFNEINDKEITTFKNETDIYKLFNIKDDITDDEILIAEIEMDNNIQVDIATIKNSSSNVISNKQFQENKKISTIRKSESDRLKESEKQQKRGLAFERIFAIKQASKIVSNEKLFNIFKEEYMNIGALSKNVDFSNKSLQNIADIIQVSKTTGDGLGYDVLEVLDNGKINRVEIKSSKGNYSIHLSNNEIEQIFNMIEDDYWKLYHFVDNVVYDRTTVIKEEIKKLKNNQLTIESSIIAESWIITFEKEN